MSLSCDTDYDGGDYDWWYIPADTVAPLATKRMRRCCSCKDRIAVGDDCLSFQRWCTPAYDSIAERIYGDEQPLPTWHLCDRCAGLYESLHSLGFYISLGDDMRKLCREYAAMQRSAGVFRGEMVIVEVQRRPQAVALQRPVGGLVEKRKG